VIGIIVPLVVILMLASCSGGSGNQAPAEDLSTSGTGTNTTGAVLSWIAPLTNTDGSNVGTLAYKLYYGTSPGFYTAFIDNITTPYYSLDSLPAGTWYIAVTAYDGSGNESDFSNEVSATF
jgi:hypothetical protein